MEHRIRCPTFIFLKQFIQSIVSPLHFFCNLIPLPLQPEKIIIEKKKTKANFTYVDGNAIQGTYHDILEDIKTTGEGENQSSDLTFVNATQLRGMLEQAGADYLLLLDNHYLKYQEEPFKTIFHYVNYSLYDGNKKKLAQGSNYFTSINPQSEQQMLKASRKSTAKMLDDVESTLTTMRK